MDETLKQALVAYLQALRASGEFDFIHISHVIPMHTKLTSVERRRAGKPTWTQFPELPEMEGIKYDKSSGGVYFNMDLWARVQQRG